MVGYIKDYRAELESDIWKMPPLYHRVWQYLKYKVNHSTNEIPLQNGEFLVIKPGQHLTSYRKIAIGVAYYEKALNKEPNPKTISKILSWLDKQQMITIDRGRGNSQYTLITIINWSFYQPKDDKGNSKVTVSDYEEKQTVDINNNDKELLKNDKNEKNYTEESEVLLLSRVGLIWKESGFPNLSEKDVNKMVTWKKDLSEELVLKAIEIAIKKNIRKYSYVEGILSRFLKEGFKTIEDIELSVQKRKKNNFQNFNSIRTEMVPEWFNKKEINTQEITLDEIDIEAERERLILELTMNSTKQY